MGPIHLPPVVGVWAGVAVVTIFLMSKTRFGRQVYAVGGEPSGGRVRAGAVEAPVDIGVRL